MQNMHEVMHKGAGSVYLTSPHERTTVQSDRPVIEADYQESQEVMVTSEMVWAGVDVFERLSPTRDAFSLVEAIYREMASVRFQQPLRTASDRRDWKTEGERQSGTR